MFIRKRELISASCQSMVHIAIYVNLLKAPYVMSQYTYFQITTINLFNERLLSSDVELNPGPSDMDTVLSAIQASEIKVLNEIRSCCHILYLVYSASLIYYANFVK